MRKEECLIEEALKKLGAEVEKIDDKSVLCNPNPFEVKKPDFDLVLSRNVSQQRAFYSTKFYESIGLRTINSSETLFICGDKFLTNHAIAAKKIKVPKAMLTLHEDMAMNVIEKFGYPCVIKPVVGSWGRLIAKIDTRDAAESIIEHKATLGSYHHSIFYIQEYIDKPGRDIRAMVIGEEVVGAIYRNSKSFRTNTSLGAKATACPLTEELKELSTKAANAVKGDIVSVDLFETKEGLVVNEVNGVTEFRNSMDVYQVNVAEKMAQYIVGVLKK
ncbi:lysine biosynthesis protein LysX [Candidatus Woesearchaeota archaeon]|nr:lysine biosynthesis protein LysX [Candidatus Woesearchaeota archaeon]